MRILVTGASGLLGNEVAAFARLRGHEVFPLARAALDVTDAAAVHRPVEASHPDAVVHCAAYTAVDRAEAEPELAQAVNRDGTRNVASAAAELNVRFVYVSTDYVFDGRKRRPYLPNDDAAPLSVYGRTKLEGERVTEAMAPEALIVRTSWLYGAVTGFAPAILRRASSGSALRVVDDQRGRPTWSRNAAEGIVELMEAGARGVFHVADRGECTWFELAQEVLRLEGLTTEVEAISSAEFGAAADRPAYSVLDLEATERTLGREMMNWREALALCLSQPTET